MRLLSEAMIEEILPLDLAIDSADEAFRAFSGKAAQIPPRSEIHRVDPKGTALVMSGLVGKDVLGVKLVSSVFTSMQPPAKNTTCMIMIWDAADLRVRGMLAADRLNEHRTAAGLASATRVLARADASTHLVVGAGKLAYTAALYVSHVRPTRRLLLASRTREKAVALGERLRADPRMRGVAIATDVEPGEAVEQADIITTVTTAERPVFDGARVRPGTHINLGGGMRAQDREMDDAVARRAAFWLDSAELCRERTGDIVLPLQSGAVSESQIRGEIGELLLGKIPGRSAAQEITVFKSLGIATQDLVLGARLLDLAEKRNLGTLFDEKHGR